MDCHSLLTAAVEMLGEEGSASSGRSRHAGGQGGGAEVSVREEVRTTGDT
jgi:hypothetical protein